MNLHFQELNFKNVFATLFSIYRKCTFHKEKKKDKKEATFPFFFKENCNIYE